MPQQRTTPAICQHCSIPFMAFDNSKARFCSNICVGKASVRPVAVRFWERVNKLPIDWLWIGNVRPINKTGEGGYGTFAVSKGYQELAHRYSWELASGEPVPDMMMVLHTCDIRHCVRNDEQGIYTLPGRELPRYGHLFLGTHEDNMLDAQLKGRFQGVAEANARRWH